MPDDDRRTLVEQGLGMTQPQGQESDEERLWVEAALRGDREAFGALVSRYAERIYNVAYRFVGEEADAHDVAQDTFVSAFKALSAFRADARFSTWLYRIAVNKCHDWLRTRGRFEQPREDCEDGAYHEGLISTATPERILSQKEVADRLMEAIQRVPPLYREAFVLKHVEGVGYEEMSEMLGVHRDTLKMRVYKARVQLCRELDELREGSGVNRKA